MKEGLFYNKRSLCYKYLYLSVVNLINKLYTSHSSSDKEGLLFILQQRTYNEEKKRLSPWTISIPRDALKLSLEVE